MSKLADHLNGRIEHKVQLEGDRLGLMQELGDAAGLDPDQLVALLGGEPHECLPAATLKGWSDIIGAPLAGLLEAAGEDGCGYSMADGDESAGDAPPGAADLPGYSGGGGGGGGGSGPKFEEGRSLPYERVQRRVFALGARAADEALTPASLSSEAPVNRGDFWEVLSHAPGAVDLSRAVGGKLPLLKDHDAREHVGVVERVALAGKRLRGALRFGKSERARSVKADVDDGIVTGISVSYELLDDPEHMGLRDGLPVLKFNRWRPFEASLLAIPADVSVGVGRSHPAYGDPKMTTETMAVTQERERQNQIRSLGTFAKIEQREIDEACSSGASLADWRERVDQMTSTQRPQSLRSPDAADREQRLAPVGMSPRDLQRFSIYRALVAVAKNNWTGAEFEREACNAAAKLAGKSGDPSRTVIPNDILERRLPRYGRRDILKSAGGANIIATDLMAGSFIDILRNASVCVRAGATELLGNVGDLSIPRRITSASAYWVTEGNSVTESTPDFDALAASPKTVGCLVDVSRKMVLQSTPEVEWLTMSDIAEVLASALDVVCIEGGGAGEPSGILQGGSIGSVTSGGTLSWAEVCAFFGELGNAWREPLAWITRPSVGAILMSTVKDAGSGQFILQDGLIANWPCYLTQNVPTDLSGGTKTALILGHFPDLAIARWGSLELMSDPYSAFASGGIRVRSLMDVDVKLRHDESFAAAIDVTP